MSFRSRFNQFFNRGNREVLPDAGAEQEIAEQPVEQTAELAARETTFDDLASVPFAGGADDVADTLSVPSGAENLTGGGRLSEATAESSLATAAETDATGAAPEVGTTEISVTPETLASETDTSEIAETAASPELQAFKHFFKIDVATKQALLDLAPSALDGYDADSRIHYADQAYKTFRSFRRDFQQLTQDFHLGTPVERSVDDFFQRGTEQFATIDSPERLYQTAFTDLRPEFVEQVKDECVGYTMFSNLSQLVGASRTVNELLHAYHSYLMNSEGLLQAIPAHATKTNQFGYEIALRGDQSAPAQQIFDALPADLDVGDTDIVAADKHIMMMVRDRGHALTISAEPDVAQPDQMWVNYNIPKICNRTMIEALPGLAGYTENGASGGFAVAADQLGAQVADFISRVPMDSDMFSPGGLCYRPPTETSV